MAVRILLVDDEEEICTLLSVYLKNENYEVVTFGLGKDALDYLKDHEVDLAVLDVMLRTWMASAFARRLGKPNISLL